MSIFIMSVVALVCLLTCVHAFWCRYLIYGILFASLAVGLTGLTVYIINTMGII